MSQETPEEADYLWKRRDALLHRIEVSIRYHRMRERSCDRWDKVAKAVAIIGGSAALADIGGREAVRWAAGIIAVTSTLSLVFAFSEKARLHADLAARYGLLEAAMVGKGERGFQEDDLNHWSSEQRKIEAREPPAIRAVVRVCEEENRTARGHDVDSPVPWYQRLVAHWF